jgi:hypothetical protein
MAARKLRPRHQEDIKKKIQTTQLINRLQNHIDGLIEMTGTQVDAAKFLINKTLSNAPTVTDNSTTIDGELDMSINVRFK